MPRDQGAMPDTLNLLIVEDSDAERALLAAELASCPRLAPRMAASLHDAADAIATTPPDVVLLDLELPDARGLNGVEWLQRHHAALAVVVLSGFAADDLLVATEAIPMVDNSRTARIFARSEARIDERIPDEAPGWIVERFETLVDTCNAAN